MAKSAGVNQSSFSLESPGGGKISGDLVFAGYGISAPKMKYDDYSDQDVEGKIVVVIRREPQQDDPESVFDGKKVTLQVKLA